MSSISFVISVVSMAWNSEHRAFVVETYFKCGDFMIAAQRQFRTHFDVDWQGRVPNRKTILLWIRNFRQTSSALKWKSPGIPRSVRTSVTIAAVRLAVTTSPQRALLNMHSPWGYLTGSKIPPIQNKDGPGTSRT